MSALVHAPRRRAAVLLLAVMVLATVAVVSLNKRPVGAVTKNLAAQCTDSGTFTKVGGNTVGDPVLSAITSETIDLALPADITATAAIRPGGRVHYKMALTLDFQALANTVLADTIKPAIKNAPSGGDALANTAALNMRITDLVTRFPVPAGATVVGSPTATMSAGGPSVTPTLASDKINVALGPIIANAKSTGSVTTTTLPNTPVFTATVQFDADNPSATAGQTITLHPGDLAFAFTGPGVAQGGFHVSVNFFNSEISGGVNGPMSCTITDQDLASTAVSGLAPFTSSDAFVKRQYADFNGKAPTAAQLAAAKTRIDGATVTPAGFIDDLRHNANGVGTDATTTVDPVTRLYQAYLQRVPDAGGLTYWIGQARGGKTLSSISQFFAKSKEFKAKYGALSNQQFVSLIYSDVLQRKPDAGGIAYWTGKLDAGLSRGKLMIGFSESPEYKAKTKARVDIAVTYISMLGTTPSSAFVTQWVTDFGTGKTVADLADSILPGTPYRTRTGLL